MIWDSAELPSSWTKALIIPILKPNKDPLVLESYRPISLTSVLCKILERVINNRLRWILESENLLNNAQCAFRPARSTTDQLLYLQHSINEAFSKKHRLLAVFFDCSRAFDLTWRYKILEKLHDWNFRGKLPMFIKNFLANRSFQTKIGNHLSSSQSQVNGVPQSSVISPTLFNIAINDITSTIQSLVKAALYADDVVIFISCSNPSLGQEIL